MSQQRTRHAAWEARPVRSVRQLSPRPRRRGREAGHTLRGGPCTPPADTGGRLPALALTWGDFFQGTLRGSGRFSAVTVGVVPWHRVSKVRGHLCQGGPCQGAPGTHGWPPGAAGIQHTVTDPSSRRVPGQWSAGPCSEFFLGPPSSEAQLPVAHGGQRPRAVTCSGASAATFLPFVAAQTAGSRPDPGRRLTEGHLGRSCTGE